VYSRPVRVLLFHKGGIGDVVFGLPLIADLRRAHPAGELVVLTHDEGREVLSLCPAIDRVISFGPMTAKWTVAGALKVLGGERFDVALTTVRSPRAGWLLRRTGARVRAGFGTGLERLFFTHRAAGDFEVVFSRRFQRLSRALGIASAPAAAPLVVPPGVREQAQGRLRALGWDGNRPLVALHAGGGWPTKRWPEEHLTTLAARLWAEGRQALLVGGPEDRPRAESIAASTHALVTAGNSVRDALAETSLCVATVGVDSGLSHAAAALGVPTLHLFGPNDPRSIDPAPHQRIVSLGLSCQPCNRRGKAQCPLGHHACMRELTPARVHEELRALLANREAAA
jgi:heptosyltransferase-2